jgi:hypothetical protein
MNNRSGACSILSAKNERDSDAENVDRNEQTFKRSIPISLHYKCGGGADIVIVTRMSEKRFFIESSPLSLVFCSNYCF